MSDITLASILTVFQLAVTATKSDRALCDVVHAFKDIIRDTLGTATRPSSQHPWINKVMGLKPHIYNDDMTKDDNDNSSSSSSSDSDEDVIPILIPSVNDQKTKTQADAVRLAQQLDQEDELYQDLYTNSINS